MKTRIALALLCASVTGTALAAEPPLPIEKKPALMLYFNKTFGMEQRRDALPFTYGLQLQQPVVQGARPMAVFDLRRHAGLGTAFSTAGVPTWVSKGLAQHPRYSLSSVSGEESSMSGEDSSVTGGYRYLLVGGILIALACATKTGICEDSNRSRSESPGLTGTAR